MSTGIIAGVCGGLADKMGLPPTLVRILWLLLSLIPWPLWVVYVRDVDPRPEAPKATARRPDPGAGRGPLTRPLRRRREPRHLVQERLIRFALQQPVVHEGRSAA
ncbi:hypothetical protein GCM10020220_051470 [Nonomuraea rubra]|uniref:PspC domain-containing protein n=1 Tax=Nonomuraea rubra TaxID=46180 RepID=UPI0031E9BED5